MPRRVTRAPAWGVPALVVLISCGPVLNDVDGASAEDSGGPGGDTETSGHVPETATSPNPGASTTGPDETAGPLPSTTSADTGSPDTAPGSTTTGSDAEGDVEYPTFRVLFDNFLRQGCTPFQNVCHANKERPNLASVEDYLSAFGAPCNEDRLENDPLRVFHRCEPQPDFIIFQSPINGWTTQIGWVDANDTDLVVSLRAPIPAPDGNFEMATIFDESTGAEYVVGGFVSDNILTIPRELLSDADALAIAEDLVHGDPNRDGILGAEDGMFQLTPGSAADSYLYAVMAGTLPDAGGHPHTGIESAELRALGCWIEQVVRPVPSSVDEPIDYDGCSLPED